MTIGEWQRRGMLTLTHGLRSGGMGRADAGADGVGGVGGVGGVSDKGKGYCPRNCSVLELAQVGARCTEHLRAPVATSELRNCCHPMMTG
jgi:hypothetical protein